MKPKRVEPMIGGGMVWALPGSTLEVMWAGPGSRLLIGQPRVAGGSVTSIDHPSASGSFDTLRDAEAALTSFVNAASLA